ncbi:MAG: sulfite exporter TauE/SafE family protein [Hyphomicrobiaceae bacterium]
MTARWCTVVPMTIEYLIPVLLGGLAGGFVVGLAGFGNGIVALGIWLFALSPTVAATLVAVCSVVAQLQNLPKIWHTIEPRRVIPFILPGLVGVPIGTVLLASVDVRTFKLMIGSILLFYALHSLIHRSNAGTSWGGRVADGAIGFGGGILGGLAGLSGPLPTIWADIRGWTKVQSRSVFQVFNLTILGSVVVSHAFAGFVTKELGFAAMIALPATMVGSWIGFAVYGRLSDWRFKQAILALLLVSGLAHILTNI